MRVDWHIVQSCPEHGTFAFEPNDTLPATFAFPKAQSIAPQRDSPKRVRPRADVDGEGSEDAQNKKRRHRLDLVTSRLSRPYASPTTHIASRGEPRIAVWARRKAPGKNVLRKAAIINSIKKKDSPKRRMESKIPTSEDEDAYITTYEGSGAIERPGELLKMQPPQQRHVTDEAVPVGLSNYDALDQEDPYDDLYQDDESDCGSVYSDFNNRDIADEQSDEYDFLTSPSHIISRYLPRSPCLEEINGLASEEDM